MESADGIKNHFASSLDYSFEGKVIIEASGLAMWCLANAVEVVNNFGDVKLNKKNQKDTQRIDPVAAMMNALALALIRRNNPTLADRLEEDGWTM